MPFQFAPGQADVTAVVGVPLRQHEHGARGDPSLPRASK